MKPQKLLLAIGLTGLLLPGCWKEYSYEGKPLNSKTDTLASDYPFATGYCHCVSLDVLAADTSLYQPDTTLALPPSILLDMPPAGDQGAQGSCSAWATIYAAGTYYTHQQTGKPYSDTGNLSPKFTFNQIAKGDCSCTSILDNLYLLKNGGACSLKAMPYDPDECIKQPDSLQRLDAVAYTIQGWQRVDLQNLSFIKRALFEKKPVLFAIVTDAGLANLAAPYVWKAREGAVGLGHALVLTGYDDSKKAFRFMNSWSAGWADSGFAWIDYDFFQANAIAGGWILI